jgi:hypothetical protein
MLKRRVVRTVETEVTTPEDTPEKKRRKNKSNADKKRREDLPSRLFYLPLPVGTNTPTLNEKPLGALRNASSRRDKAREFLRALDTDHHLMAILEVQFHTRSR